MNTVFCPGFHAIISRILQRKGQRIAVSMLKYALQSIQQPKAKALNTLLCVLNASSTKSEPPSNFCDVIEKIHHLKKICTFLDQLEKIGLLSDPLTYNKSLDALLENIFFSASFQTKIKRCYNSLCSPQLD